LTRTIRRKPCPANALGLGRLDRATLADERVDAEREVPVLLGRPERHEHSVVALVAWKPERSSALVDGFVRAACADRVLVAG
jgi:hypothetical protein